ncbi:hypothetical protein OG345_41000 (plasmid) [Streptomyces sp. NBC_01220]|uniref:hypothetical protein n=1 Tax=Streptomyces sp. NBC_01220 TaxID=2903781 RepID=UPI002F9115A6|nr:hypothetical protein OG345_41000 [Streptomyces sp. NBC_01220]
MAPQPRKEIDVLPLPYSVTDPHEALTGVMDGDPDIVRTVHGNGIGQEAAGASPTNQNPPDPATPGTRCFPAKDIHA